MKLIHVIPVSRGISKEILSYFTARDVADGDIVSAPLRKKTVPAIVVSSEDISDAKTKIRSSGYAIRKIAAQKPKRLLSSEFISAAKDASEYFASTTGAVLHGAVPNAVWEDIGKIKMPIIKDAENTSSFGKKTVLQAERSDRFASYKSLVREEFARNASVFLLVPTIQDAEKAQEFLKKGIEQYTFLLHGTLSKKEILSQWRKVLSNTHPVLIIATGTFLSMPRSDIGTIIVERENSRAYKMLIRPFLDMRMFAELFASRKKAHIIFGDLPLRVETVWRYRSGEFDEFAPLKLRTVRAAQQILVDMRNSKHQKEGRFQIISNELKELAETVIKNGKHLFVFAARRGLSTTTTCRDCGRAVTCAHCGAPVVLHATAKGNIFVCHACGKARSAHERCKNCASWKLETLGIGVQRVESELKKLFPNSIILTVDKDTSSTPKQIRTVIEKFYETKGSLLVGTEMTLSYLDKPVAVSAVASIDSLFSLPEWRMSEKILSILLKIKEATEKTLLIQTRRPEQRIFEIAKKGNLVDFYRNEIKQRKEFGYPPFNVFIKITAIGTSLRVSKEIVYLKKLLKKYHIEIYPPSIRISKGRYAMHGLLRVEKDKWPEKQIVEILRSLPPYFSVDVDPESLL